MHFVSFYTFLFNFTNIYFLVFEKFIYAYNEVWSSPAHMVSFQLHVVFFFKTFK